MYIRRIEYDGFDTGDLASGRVSFIADTRQVHVLLTLQRRGVTVARQKRLLTLVEALRRLRRVPEFRAHGSLRLAPGLLPVAPTATHRPMVLRPIRP